MGRPPKDPEDRRDRPITGRVTRKVKEALTRARGETPEGVWVEQAIIEKLRRSRVKVAA